MFVSRCFQCACVLVSPHPLTTGSDIVMKLNYLIVLVFIAFLNFGCSENGTGHNREKKSVAQTVVETVNDFDTRGLAIEHAGSKKVVLHDVRGLKPVTLYVYGQGKPVIEKYALSESDGVFVTSAGKNDIVLWNWPEKKVVKKIYAGSAVVSLAVNERTRRICVATQAREIEVFNYETGEKIVVFPDIRPSIPNIFDTPVSICLSPDGTRLASAYGRGVDIYDMEKLEFLTAAELPVDVTNYGGWPARYLYETVLFSPDSKYLFGGGGKFIRTMDSSPISMWDAKSGKLMKEFKGGSDCPAGKLYLNEDGTAIFNSQQKIDYGWVIKTGEQITSDHNDKLADQYHCEFKGSLRSLEIERRKGLILDNEDGYLAIYDLQFNELSRLEKEVPYWAHHHRYHHKLDSKGHLAALASGGYGYLVSLTTGQVLHSWWQELERGTRIFQSNPLRKLTIAPDGSQAVLDKKIIYENKQAMQTSAVVDPVKDGYTFKISDNMVALFGTNSSLINKIKMKGTITSALINPDEEIIYIATGGKSVGLASYDIHTGVIVDRFNYNAEPIKSMSLNIRTNILYLCTGKKIVAIDADSQERVAEMEAFDDAFAIVSGKGFYSGTKKFRGHICRKQNSQFVFFKDEDNKYFNPVQVALALNPGDMEVAQAVMEARKNAPPTIDSYTYYYEFGDILHVKAIPMTLCLGDSGSGVGRVRVKVKNNSTREYVFPGTGSTRQFEIPLEDGMSTVWISADSDSGNVTSKPVQFSVQTTHP